MKHRNNNPSREKFDPETANRLHLHYIETRWEIAAALAWKGYIALGRGALLFSRSPDPGGEWDCTYWPLESIEGYPMMAEYAHLLTSYDPTQQIVAVFLTPPAFVSAYCGGLTPERDAPPEAYKRIGSLIRSN